MIHRQMNSTHLYCSESQWVLGLTLFVIPVDFQLPLAAGMLLRWVWTAQTKPANQSNMLDGNMLYKPGVFCIMNLITTTISI